MGRLPLHADRLATITVQAVDETGRPGQHSIRAAMKGYARQMRARNGSDAASIGAWPENGVFATQLGPNRNGRPS
jgi:3',5'-cyclic-AMP phosphodiesterase